MFKKYLIIAAILTLGKISYSMDNQNPDDKKYPIKNLFLHPYPARPINIENGSNESENEQEDDQDMSPSSPHTPSSLQVNPNNPPQSPTQNYNFQHVAINNPFRPDGSNILDFGDQDDSMDQIPGDEDETIETVPTTAVFHNISNVPAYDSLHDSPTEIPDNADDIANEKDLEK